MPVEAIIVEQTKEIQGQGMSATYWLMKANEEAKKRYSGELDISTVISESPLVDLAMNHWNHKGDIGCRMV